MIFKTFNSDIDKATDKIGMFGKSFYAMKTDYKHGNGLLTSIFGGSSVSKNDKQRILDFNTALQNGVKPAKAWATTMSEATLAAQTQARQCLKNKNSLVELANNFNTLTLSEKAAELGMKALSIAGNMLLTWGITELISGISQFVQASKDIANSAQEIGSSFKETSKDVDNYKQRVEKLQDTINNSSSSISDVTEARKELMTIQDELIDKYGTEEESIKNITDAVNGETSAWEKLSKTKWNEAKNNFNNNSKDGWWSGLWKNASNFIHGYKTNIDRMKKEFGEYSVDINTGAVRGKENRNQINEILSKFGDLKATGQYGMKQLTLSGNATEVYNKLLKIQSIFDSLNNKSIGKNSSWSQQLGDMAESAKAVSEKYQDFWDDYVLNDKILTKGSKYASSYKQIIDDYEKYQEAVNSKNEKLEKESKQTLVEDMSDVMDLAFKNKDKDVLSFIENMYPEIKTEIDSWRFDINFKANTNGLEDETKSALNKLKGFTAEDLKDDNFNPNAVTKEQADAYNQLIAIADKYNLSIDELISKLQKKGLIVSKSYQQLVNKFGKAKVDKLSKKDLEIAYTIPNITLLSWDKLIEKINEVKKKAKEDSKVPFNEAWKELGDSTKKSLLELAEAGELTKKTFQNVEGSSDFLKKLGLSKKDIDKVINKINKLVDNSKQLSTMRTGISSITSAYDEKKDSKYNTVSASTLSSMYDTLGIKEWDKENIKAWENYKEIAGDSAQSLSSLAKAQNKLAAAYLNSHEFLTGLTKETQDYYDAQLTEMGVTNAHEITTKVLAERTQYLSEKKAFAAGKSKELTRATAKELNLFIQEQGGADKVSASLLTLAMNKEMVNNHALDFSGDVSNLLSYVEAIEGTNKALNALRALKAFQSGDTDTASKLGYSYMDTSSMSKLQKDAQNEVKRAKEQVKKNQTQVQPKISLGNLNNNSKDKKDSSSKSKTKATAQIFDFIERRINKLTKTIDYAKAKMEALFTVKAKNNQINKELKNTTKLIEAQRKAASKYQGYADKLAKNATKGKKGLKQSEVNKYIKLIENGSLTKDAIKSIKNEKLKTFIENYQTYYDKAVDAKQAVQENIASIVELNKQKLDNITSYYDTLISKIEATTSKLEAQLSLQKTVNSVYGNGEIGSVDTYNKLITTTSSDIKQKQSEKNAYANTRKSTRSNLEKNLKKNGVSKSERKSALAQFDAETKSKLEEFDTSIYELESKLYDYSKELVSLPWDKASAKIEKLSASYDVLNAKLANATSTNDKNKILDGMNENLDSQLSEKKSAIEANKQDIKDTAKWLNKNTKIKVKAGEIIDKKDLNAIVKKYGKNSKQYAKAIEYNNSVNQLETNQTDYDKSIEENKSSKSSNAKTKFTNIQNDYQRQLDSISDSADKLNNELSILEAKGYTVTANYYDNLADNASETIDKLTQQKAALEQSLQESLENGDIQEGTDDYYEMVDAINSVDKAINDATLSQAQFLQKVRETSYELDKNARAAISNFNDEAEFYKDILSQEELYDDNGNLNDAGKSTMQLSMVEMSNYIALNNKLKDSIVDLDTQYADGKMGFDEYYKQRQQLLSEQKEAIKGYYSETDAIKTLIENGYNAQKEALSDLISKYTEALDAEKNLHDYEKNIKEKTDNIDSIKKRIAALQGNDTEEARQKIQKLTVDLKTAQDDLEEAQYEQYLSDQKDILDDLQNDYQNFVEEQLKNVQELINALINDANTNTQSVVEKLDGISKLWGVDNFKGSDLETSISSGSFGSVDNQKANAVAIAEQIYDKFKNDSTTPPADTTPPNSDVTDDSEDPDELIRRQREEAEKQAIEEANRNLPTLPTPSTSDIIKAEEDKVAAPGETNAYAEQAKAMAKASEKTEKENETKTFKKILKNYTGDAKDTTKPLRKVKAGETSKTALNKKLSADYGVVVKSGAGVHGQSYIEMFARAIGLTNSAGDWGKDGEVYQHLKKNYPHLGFSTGGVVDKLNKIALANGDDAWTTVKAKERVLTPLQNEMWEKWTNNLPNLVNMADYLPKMSDVPVKKGTNSVTVGDISYTMEFPNVTDPASMKEAIKKDTSLQNLMRDVTIGQMKKGNKLGMMKY